MSATGMSSRYSSRVLEGFEHLLDRVRVADDVLRGDECECVADVVRELRMGADRVRMNDGLVVAAEDEERERGGVLPDRRLGFGGPELERPASRLLGRVPVSGEHERLHRADRTPPAPGGSAGDALAIALGRAAAATPRPRPAGLAISSASPAPPAAFPIRVNCRWRASGSSGSRPSPSS